MLLEKIGLPLRSIDGTLRQRPLTPPGIDLVQCSFCDLWVLSGASLSLLPILEGCFLEDIHVSDFSAPRSLDAGWEASQGLADVGHFNAFNLEVENLTLA